MESKFAYFQFNPGNEFNVFVRTSHDEDVEKLKEFFVGHKFEEVEEKVYRKVLTSKKPYRLLDFSKATPALAKSINSVRSELDAYGAEQITPNKNYYVYRYQSVALMVYSFHTRVWDLGYICDFTDEGDVTALSIVLKRYIAWAMAEFGVVGFWGAAVEEGVVVQKAKTANHEVVYFDIKRNLIYSVEGTRKISAPFYMIRLDETLKGSTRPMNTDELYSFLMTKSTYFSYSGLPKSIQTHMFTLAGAIDGIVYPSENFEGKSNPDMGTAA